MNDLQQLLTPRLTKYVPFDPTPKQTAFLLMNDIKELLYGGAAGGGKSVAQLMAALQYVDVPGYSAILFRKTFSDLSLPGALIPVSKEWLMPFVDRGEVKWSEKEKTYTFKSGATMAFGYLESVNDCYRYQGAEFQYIGIDEATHIHPKNYRYMFSRLRKTLNIPVPLRYRATCNPGGEFGDFYYNRFFVDKGKRIFIPAGIQDNPYLDTEDYKESLQELDPVTRQQLLDGNWEIREQGGMFKSDWMIEVPKVPNGARFVRFWDMASTDPKKRKRKGMRDPDWTVGLKLAEHQGMYYIVDIARAQKTPGDVEKMIYQTAILDGYGVKIRMEQEPGSSGDMVVDYYARKVLNGFDFKGVRSTGSKAQRADPVSSAMQTGRVMIVKGCRNRSVLNDELDTFPFGNKDDTVDSLSGGYASFRHATTTALPTSFSKVSYWRGVDYY